MAADITVPTLGESVTTATIARWMKKVGDNVAADEPLVELETDKVTVEINAPEAGVISEIIMPEGSEVEIGAVLGRIGGARAATAAAPVAAKPATVASPGVHAQQSAPGPVARPGVAPLPAAAKLMEEQKIAPADIGTGTAKDGRISKGDVLAFVNKPTPAAVP
ncbi:MAG: dihydrolipoamide succinyltransferase, partial [Acidocella sp. 20-58-15]